MNGYLTIAAVVGAPILLWLSCVIATRIWYRRLMGLPLMGEGVINSVPYVEVRTAREAAATRREQVLAFLRNTGYETEFRGEPTPTREFIELPPGFSGGGGKEEFDAPEGVAFWRASRLQFQLQQDHFLLVERVVDYLVFLLRDKILSLEEFPECIRLENVPWSKFRSRFPWRVVILTKSPEALAERLEREDVRDWFGIGIDLLKIPLASSTKDIESNDPEDSPSAISPQGRCSIDGDGLEGIVGGLIRDTGEIFGVTCRHVLSPECGSVVWPQPVRPANQEFTNEFPDAAFISLGAGCFVSGEPIGQPIGVASSGDIEMAAFKETKIKKISNTVETLGIIRGSVVAGIKLHPYFYRGPHIHISPFFYKRFGIIWPRKRLFSKEGDSGAWIINAETGQWVGMLVGGSDLPRVDAYALAAFYVLDAFSRYRNASASTGMSYQTPELLSEGAQ